MQVKPAKLEYVQHAMDGKVAVVTTDSSDIAKRLQEHDPCLQLWYLEDVLAGAPPVYTVWRCHINGRPCPVEEMQSAGLEPEFILSALECDDRIVQRIRQIDGHERTDYDFTKAVERNQERFEQDKHTRVREMTEETGEELAHAIRKDLGVRYRGRAFVPKGVK